jgi:hypothetical protein
VSKQPLRSGSMYTVSIVGSSSVLIHPICAPIEEAGS